jgi:Zn-finger nucleic acid-binding protein
MTCPSCGAPMHQALDALECDYCHTIYFPNKDDNGVRVLGESPDQTCPICTTPLSNAAVETVNIAYCSTCRGMSIPMAAFSTLVDELRSQQTGRVIPPSANPAELRRTINCPHCHQQMEAHFYGGPGNVVMDSCDPCSLNWLDHGELSRIAHAPSLTQSSYY